MKHNCYYAAHQSVSSWDSSTLVHQDTELLGPMLQGGADRSIEEKQLGPECLEVTKTTLIKQRGSLSFTVRRDNDDIPESPKPFRTDVTLRLSPGRALKATISFPLEKPRELHWSWQLSWQIPFAFKCSRSMLTVITPCMYRGPKSHWHSACRGQRKQCSTTKGQMKISVSC